MQQKTIWFDVTSLMYWDTTPVGIVRVELELASYFLKNQPGINFRFVTYNVIFKCYVEISLSALQKRVDILIESIKNSFPKKTTAKLQQFFVRYKLRRLNRLMNFGIKLINNQKGIYQMLKKLKFNANDILLLGGFQWVYPGFDKFISRLKKDNNIIIANITYDIIPILFPYFTSQGLSDKFTRYYNNALATYNVFLCISEKTKTDFINYAETLGVTINADVISLGSNPSYVKKDIDFNRIKQKYNLNKDYTMFVSSMDERKNHALLYQVYQLLLSEGHHNIPLMLWIGKASEASNELIYKIQQESGMDNYIRVLRDVDDNDLVALYQHCQYTLFPSLYEGWGMPVTESLCHGKYCLSSSAASLPEAGCGFTALLNPYDSRAWADAILHLQNKVQLGEYTARIQKEFKPMEWHEAVNNLYDILAKVATT